MTKQPLLNWNFASHDYLKGFNQTEIHSTEGKASVSLSPPTISFGNAVVEPGKRDFMGASPPFSPWRNSPHRILLRAA